MVHAYNPSVWAGEEEDEEFGHKANLRPVWATRDLSQRPKEN